MVKAIVFDLDDTIVSELQYIKSGYHHIANVLITKLGIPEDKIFSDLMVLFTESNKRVFNRLLYKYGEDFGNEFIMYLVDEYRNHLPQIELYDDVIPCINQLKSKGLKVAIITDGYANAQKQKLKAVNAYEIFDEIIITDEYGRLFWKPHPKAFEEMSKRLKVELKEMIFIGDNPEKDFNISKIYPIKTVRIYRDGIYQRKKYLDDIKEMFAIHSLSQVEEIITIIEKNTMYDDSCS